MTSGHRGYAKDSMKYLWCIHSGSSSTVNSIKLEKHRCLLMFFILNIDVYRCKIDIFSALVYTIVYMKWIEIRRLSPLVVSIIIYNDMCKGYLTVGWSGLSLCSLVFNFNVYTESAVNKEWKTAFKKCIFTVLSLSLFLSSPLVIHFVVWRDLPTAVFIKNFTANWKSFRLVSLR